MNALRALRKSRGWTQIELAGHAQISPRTVLYIEKGKPCYQETQDKLLDVFGFSWFERHALFESVPGSLSHSRWKAREVPAGSTVESLRSEVAAPRTGAAERAEGAQR